MKKVILLTLIVIIAYACTSDEEIIAMLKSNDKTTIMIGATKAADSRNVKFVPYLLENAFDYRTSTTLRYKGMTVYQIKMYALKEILKKEPPVKLTYEPDSTIIKFYTEIAVSRSLLNSKLKKNEKE